MPALSLTVDGVERSVEQGTTGTEVFAERADVIVIRVDGTLRDLDTVLADGQSVEGVTISEPDGLMVLRHSTAHVLAQAVQAINPDAKLGVGPPIENGFYYDFDVATPFTPEDLKELEKAMQRIQREGQAFRRREVTREEALAELAHEPYKCELLTHSAEGAEGASVEIGDGDITIYDNVRRTGEVAWKDLCRGPHVPSTKVLGIGWALQRSAAAYWKGSEKNPQLQRIYGTAWPSKEELVAYKERLAEAERRDHRRLGQELDLFSFPDAIGSGLAVFHPKGGIVRMAMEEYSRQRHVDAGYEEAIEFAEKNDVKIPMRK